MAAGDDDGPEADEVLARVELPLSSEALRLRDPREEVDGSVAEEADLSSATIFDLILLPSVRMFRMISACPLSALADLDLEGTSILAGVSSFLSAPPPRSARPAFGEPSDILGDSPLDVFVL